MSLSVPVSSPPWPPPELKRILESNRSYITRSERAYLIHVLWFILSNTPPTANPVSKDKILVKCNELKQNTTKLPYLSRSWRNELLDTISEFPSISIPPKDARPARVPEYKKEKNAEIDKLIQNLQNTHISPSLIYQSGSSIHILTTPSQSDRVKQVTSQMDSAPIVGEMSPPIPESGIITPCMSEGTLYGDGSCGFFVRLSDGKHVMITAKHTFVGLSDNVTYSDIDACYVDIGDSSHRNIHKFDLPWSMTRNYDNSLLIRYIQSNDYIHPDDIEEESYYHLVKPNDPVSKIGAETGLTVGKFMGIGNVYFDELKGVKYEDVILVNSPNTIFTDNGDSGSIYYIQSQYNDEPVFLPIALHVASVEIKCFGKISIGIPLTVVFKELFNKLPAEICDHSCMQYKFHHKPMPLHGNFDLTIKTDRVLPTLMPASDNSPQSENSVAGGYSF